MPRACRVVLHVRGYFDGLLLFIAYGAKKCLMVTVAATVKLHATRAWHLRKLLQKPHIVLEQQPYIVERVHQPTHPIDAEAESEAGKLLRIHTDDAQHVWMNHS